MRNNELIFCKHRDGRYTVHLCKIDQSTGYWCYGSGIGKNKLLSFIDLCKDLHRFNHFKEVLKVKNVYYTT